MTRPTTYVALLATLLTLLPLAGCGNGERTVEEGLTKAQYRKRANLICSQASTEQAEKVNRYGIEHPNDGNKQELVQQAGIPPLEKALRNLQNLPSPADFEAEINTFLAKFEGALKEAKEDPVRIMDGPDPIQKAAALAARYQLGDCGVLR